MGAILTYASLFALVGSALATSFSEMSSRQSRGKSLEFGASNSGPFYRLTIPAVSAPPFDILLQIIVPNPANAKWAGVAFGGGMLRNPLVVAWPNGNTAVASTRWAT
jgi:hypothetical protein